MSFLSTLGSIAKGVGGFLKSNSLGANLAKTALYGLALKKVSDSINKSQDTSAAAADTGSRVTVNPDTTNSVPVVYGQAYVGGVITDAYLTANNKTMWFCVTVSEKTGNLINGTPSTFSFNEIYMDGLRLDFKPDGFTVDLAYDEDGNSTDKWNGLMKIYPFNGSSSNPTSFTTESGGSGTAANNLFPGWTVNHTMSNLHFCLIKIDYDAKNKITSLGDLQFRVTNSMSKPGDVLYDYMTNTVYGAGIADSEIYSS